MTEATALDVPSHPLRGLIVATTANGLELEREVAAFTDAVRQAVTTFGSEVDPLHLPDADYQLVAAASGLQGLLTLAHRMETALSEGVSAT